MQKVEFTGSQGDTLAARLDMPDSTPKAYALFAHCFTCNKDIFAASRIAKELTQQGIAVLRFDFTGLGASEGEFANTNFTSNVQDLLKAADYMQDNHEAPAILIGHSLGGAAILAAAKDIPEAKAVVTIAAPADAAHVAHHFSGARDEILEKGEAEVQLVGRPFRIQKQFIEDIESQTMDTHIKGLKRALLVMHAPLDETVGVENATHIFVTAQHPKSFVSLDDADHLLSKKDHAIYAADVIAAWASRYAGYEAASADEKNADEKSEAENIDGVFVRETGNGKFQQDVRAGKHRFFADEPESFGGADTGPDPYALVLAGLGACTSMTLRMYADRKDLALEGVEVHLSHQKIHAEDCETCETKEGKIDKISRSLTITGKNLTEEQRVKLLEIADKCPVHKTLESEILIETEISETAQAKNAA